MESTLAGSTSRLSTYTAIQPASHRVYSSAVQLPQPFPQTSSQQGILPPRDSSTFNSSIERRESMTNSASLTPSREQQQIHRPGTLDFSHGTFPLEGPSEELEKISPVTPMGFLGNSGILRLFEPDHRRIATSEQRDMRSPVVIRTDLPPLELQQSFAESYFEFCWPWCPILDKNTLFDELEHTPSVLLTNALALLGTRIRPPTIQHATASEYYNRAKMLFYTDDEDNPIVSLQAIMLFYWWAPRR